MHVWNGVTGLACISILATGALAQDERMERCLTLSFAPLDENIPACTALIDEADRPDAPALGDLLAARATALEFALTYHGEHEISPDALLTDALADLDRAVAIDPRHHAQRADVLFRLSRFEEAAASFTAAIAADPSAAAARLESRSVALEASGDLSGAIDDMTAAIRLTTTAPELQRLTRRRAELREAAGDRAGARADFERVLERDPADVMAQEALARLGDAQE